MAAIACASHKSATDLLRIWLCAFRRLSIRPGPGIPRLSNHGDRIARDAHNPEGCSLALSDRQTGPFNDAARGRTGVDSSAPELGQLVAYPAAWSGSNADVPPCPNGGGKRQLSAWPKPNSVGLASCFPGLKQADILMNCLKLIVLEGTAMHFRTIAGVFVALLFSPRARGFSPRARGRRSDTRSFRTSGAGDRP